jgi:hypothetical protein
MSPESATLPTPPSPTGVNPPSTGSQKPNISALANDPLNPSAPHVIDALRNENASLRNRLADAERAYVRASRQNDLYRGELIDLR